MVLYLYYMLNVEVAIMMSLVAVQGEEKKGKDGSYIQTIQKKKISMEEFESKLQYTDTYHDVVRLFYHERIPNDLIDDIVRNGFPLRIGLPNNTLTTNTMLNVTESVSPVTVSDATQLQTTYVPEEATWLFRTGNRRLKRVSGHSVTSARCKNCAKANENIPTDAFVAKRRSGKRRGKRKKGRRKCRDRKKGKRKIIKGPEPIHPALKDVYNAHKHFHHVVQETICKFPEPEVECVRCHSSTPHTVYFPRCTVVYRCRNTTGCCNATSTCVPKPGTTEYITKHVYVLQYDQENKVQLASPFVKKFTFASHTQCYCQPVQQIEACWAKKCPYPYKSRNAGFGCKCQCEDEEPGYEPSEDRKKCLRIYKGRKEIRRKHLRECERSQDCMSPTCDEGLVFNSPQRKCLPVN